MKRTLLEISCGLAVLVLLASFHNQIARLSVQGKEVASLRSQVDAALAAADSRQELTELRDALLHDVDTRLGALQQQVDAAAASRGETQKLKAEIEATRSESERLRSELIRDMSRTKELVDAYQNEMRTKDKVAQASIFQTRSALESLAVRVLPDPDVLTKEMLAPTVQLNGDDTVGSGTLIWSGPNAASGEVESWVLTSYHVVRNILADSPAAKRDGVAVTIYLPAGKREVRADMVAHDGRIDAALLKLRSAEVWPNVARIVSRSRAADLKVWDSVYAVGCPLGNDPIPTQGEISSLRNELNGSNYWMINAPTYFGNSGGGVYLSQSRELVGVFSKIYTHGKGQPVVVPHMGLCTPITAIIEWFDREKLAFLLEPSIDATALAAPAPAPAPAGH